MLLALEKILITWNTPDNQQNQIYYVLYNRQWKSRIYRVAETGDLYGWNILCMINAPNKINQNVLHDRLKLSQVKRFRGNQHILS